MNKLLLTFGFYLFLFVPLLAQNQDTIVVSFNKTRYENVVKEELEKGSGNFAPGLYDKYDGCRLGTFSIPVFEWNQKAQKYTCESHEKLENMLLFEDNPYFQIVLLTNGKSDIVGTFDLSISKSRRERRIRDSIDWVSKMPDIPFSYFSSNPFPSCDLQLLKEVYKYHLKHPTDFIFRIADFEGFWVVRSHKLQKLEGGRLVDANKYLYMSAEEYIQDVASGSFRIGKKYTGCFDKETAKRLSVKGKDVYINIIK